MISYELHGFSISKNLTFMSHPNGKVLVSIAKTTSMPLYDGQKTGGKVTGGKNIAPFFNDLEQQSWKSALTAQQQLSPPPGIGSPAISHGGTNAPLSADCVVSLASPKAF